MSMSAIWSTLTRFDKVRREYFTGIAPASTMVEICKMTSPDYLIEINAIAVLAD